MRALLGCAMLLIAWCLRAPATEVRACAASGTGKAEHPFVRDTSTCPPGELAVPEREPTSSLGGSRPSSGAPACAGALEQDERLAEAPPRNLSSRSRRPAHPGQAYLRFNGSSDANGKRC